MSQMLARSTTREAFYSNNRSNKTLCMQPLSLTSSNGLMCSHRSKTKSKEAIILST